MSDIVDMIMEAKKSYKKPFASKYLITQREYDWLVSIYPKVETKENIKAFLDEHYTVIMPLEATDHYINETLRDGLGSLASEQRINLHWYTGRGKYRVATNPNVSGIRNNGFRTSAVYIDEPFDPTAEYDKWSGRHATSTGLEYGVLHGRTGEACLPGTTKYWRSSLSKAAVVGHKRIEVEL